MTCAACTLRKATLYLVVCAALLNCQAAVASSWTPADESHCLSAPYDEAETEAQERVQNLMTRLREALVGFPSMLNSLDTVAPDVCLADGLVVEVAYYEPGENRIYLSTGLSPGLSVAVLVHEVRHVEQSNRGICPSPGLDMKSYAQAVLALEADASVVTLLVARERREAGDGSLWSALVDWSPIRDIAVRFETALSGGATLSDAAEVAFEQWFALESRRFRYYLATCSDYLDRADRTHALPRYLSLPPDYLRDVCVLPGGVRYTCTVDDS